MTEIEKRLAKIEQVQEAILNHLHGTILAVDGEFFVAFPEEPCEAPKK